MESPIKINAEGGFTLVEVAIAVAILGVALTTLVGLHTRMLNTYYTERNRTKASFVAQYVMTVVEASADAPEVGSSDGELKDLLQDRGYYSGSELEESKEDKFEGWKYHYEVQSVDLPLIEDALRRIDLELQWGETEDDVYTLSYFMNVTKTPDATGAASANPFGQGASQSGTNSGGT